MKKLLIVLIVISSSLLTLAQPWSVTPADFEFSMNVTGKVSISENIIDQQDSYLGAFVGEDCVGLASPIENDGEFQLFYFTIYSNSTSGDLIEFKFMDELESEHNIANHIEFVSDSYVGSAETPFVWMDVEAYAATDFLSFSFAEEFSSAVINSAAKTIEIVVVHDANRTSLIPNFELSPGASAKVNSVLQESGVTANDYSSAVVYSVTGVDASSADWTVNVSLDNSDVEQFNSDQISVYPNPASDFVQIDMKDIDCDEIQILDLQGKVVIDYQYNSSDVKIDISKLKNGIYFIRLNNGIELFQFEFVKN